MRACTLRCQRVLADLENAAVALGNIPAERIPLYARGHSSDWVYMDPPRDFYDTPLGKRY